jgi:hypothetical protein
MRLEAVERNIIDLINQHGWAVMGIFGDPDTNTPPFCYTVGARTKGLPDLIMSGLHQQGRPFLNDLLQRALAGEVLQEGVLYTEIITLPLALKRVTTEQVKDRMVKTHSLYDQLYPGVVQDLFQVVYPDAKGRFPWEDGYDFKGQEFLWMR